MTGARASQLTWKRDIEQESTEETEPYYLASVSSVCSCPTIFTAERILVGGEIFLSFR